MDGLLAPKSIGGGYEKRPLLRNWPRAASTDAHDIEQMFGSLGGLIAIGVVTGSRSGIWVLDEDDRDAVEREGWSLPPTLTVDTPRPGRHRYFQWDPAQPVRNQKLAPGLETRGEGGFIVAPGSPGYEATDEAIEVAQTPPDLMRALATLHVRPSASGQGDGLSVALPASRYGGAALHGELARLIAAPAGQRNEQLNRSAFALGQLVAGGHLTKERVVDKLSAAARSIGLESREIEATIRSGLAAGEAHPRESGSQPTTGLTQTDMGNARGLAAFAKGRLLHTASLGWLHWDGRRWERDAEGRAVELGKQFIRCIHHQAVEVAHRTGAEKATKWSVLSARASRIEAMLRLARSEPGLALRPSDLDCHTNLLNVANGTVSLTTGTLRPHEPSDLMTRMTPVRWNAAASAPRFRAFLERIQPDPELRAFIQKWFGYCLSGDMREQAFVFFYGHGQNGKSVLVNVVAHVLGEYAMTAPRSAFTPRRSDGPTNDMAGFAGIRMVTSQETDHATPLSESLIKQVTGGDRIRARHLYREYFEFQPEFKVTMSGNHKPVIRGTDEGIWRRVRVVPFEQRIPDDEVDQELPAKLLAEAEGILVWLVEGHALWRQEGLGTPTAVAQATGTYRAEEDPLAPFLAERCRVAIDKRVRASLLQTAYQQFEQRRAEKPLAWKSVARMLEARGFTRSRSGGIWWCGLELRSSHGEERAALD